MESQILDTKVLLLKQIIYVQKAWIHKSEEYIPVHLLLKYLEDLTKSNIEEVVKTLLAGYVLSGCDTVSYLFNRGKKKAAKVSLECVGKLNFLADYGEHVVLAKQKVEDEARIFFVMLYEKDAMFKSLDKLREQLFASSKSDIRSLPPTDDAFHFHYLRALYQLLIYKRAYRCKLDLPPATEFGRYVIDGVLVTKLIRKIGTPSFVIQKFCRCKGKCVKNCSCAKRNIKCTAGCLCTEQIEFFARLQSNSDTSDSD